MRRFVLLFLAALALAAATRADATDEGVSPAAASAIELEAALDLALERSPVLEAMSARVGQAAARSKQAALLPNPELRLEMEDFAGSGAFEGTDELQATVGVGQLLEMGGKRGARLRAADAGEAVAALDQERVRRDVVAETSRAFIEALAAQSERELVEETLRIDEQIVAVVARRLRGGSSSRVELTKAEVALAGARMAQARAERALLAAHRRLAETWGDDVPQFHQVIGQLSRIAPPPSLAALLAKVDQNPDLRRSVAEIARREAGVAVEEREAIPDVEVGLGYRRLAGPDDDAMVADLRVPFPFFNRNQGALLEAQQRVAGAHAEQRATLVEVTASVREAHEALSMAYEEVQALDRTVLPAAATAFATIRDGYREGRFSYLDLLDAERTLNDARKRRIEALAAYHTSLVEIDHLIGEGKKS